MRYTCVCRFEPVSRHMRQALSQGPSHSFQPSAAQTVGAVFGTKTAFQKFLKTNSCDEVTKEIKIKTPVAPPYTASFPITASESVTSSQRHAGVGRSGFWRWLLVTVREGKFSPVREFCKKISGLSQNEPSKSVVFGANRALFESKSKTFLLIAAIVFPVEFAVFVLLGYWVGKSGNNKH